MFVARRPMTAARRRRRCLLFTAASALARLFDRLANEVLVFAPVMSIPKSVAVAAAAEWTPQASANQVGTALLVATTAVLSLATEHSKSSLITCINLALVAARAETTSAGSPSADKATSSI